MGPRAITHSLAVRSLAVAFLILAFGELRIADAAEGDLAEKRLSDWPELTERTATEFARTAFREPAAAGLTQAQLSRWLESLPGKGSRLRSERSGDVTVAGFEGLARLRAPWLPDAVLQIAPFDHDGLGIHFWSGMNGVSIYYYEHPRPIWAGYQTTRRENEPTPRTHVLLASDNDRYQRALRGTVEVRHQEGTLVLSRGDLRLLTVPLPDALNEVIFERRASFRAFAMYRGPSIPYERAPDGRELLESQVPSRLRWGGDVSDGAKLTRDPAGPVRLERPESAGTVWSGVRLPARGLYEARIQLGPSDPGTGIYFADDSGKPRAVIALRRHSQSGTPVLALIRPEAAGLEVEGDPRNQRVSFSGAGQWLRIIAGPGTIRCDVSGDGRHWGRALEPLRGISGAFSQIGLIAFQQPAPAQITLERLEIRQLSDLRSAADETLLDRVPVEIRQPVSRFDEWCGRVLQTQPTGVSLQDWRMACAVTQLSEGSPGMVGNAILEGLLEDCLDSEMATDRFLRILDQAALIYDGWNARECYRLTQFYEAAGLKQARRGHPAPYSLVGRSLLANPLATSAQYQTMPESLVRCELACLITYSRWQEARDLCQALNFWNRPSRPEQTWPDHRQNLEAFVEWVGSVAAQELGEVTAENNQDRAPLCPVSVTAGRSGLNFMSELKTALEGAQYDDACRLLLAARAEQTAELLPVPGDSNLLVGLSLAVASGMNQYPEWQNVMRMRYERLARARVRIARDAAQADELQTLAAQLTGTSAAVDARQWLGDRALIEGNFLGALDEFEEALMSADREQRDTLEGRITLARACLGLRPAGDHKVAGSSPAAGFPPHLERVLIDLQARSQKDRHSQPGEKSSPRAFPSGVWEVEPGGEIQLDPARQPAEEPARLDWSGRQLAPVQNGDLLYVSSRRQIVCFNLKTNRQLWRVPLPEPDPTLAGWPMLAFQPVATASRLFVRTSENDWLGLNCYDGTSGKLRWRTERGLTVLSDPLLLQGNLYCFMVSSSPLDRVWRMELTTIDPESGTTIGRAPVLEINRPEGRVISCQFVVAGNRLIASVAGATLCCDLTGRPVWLRRAPWLPANADPAAAQEDYGTPLVTGERVLVLQAGALELCCLENRTGKLVWRRPLAESRRLIGADESRAYVQTADGLTAIALADGAVEWWRPFAALLEANRIHRDQPLLIVQREELPNQMARPLLTWIDPSTGNDLAFWPLAQLAVRNPQLSHLLPREDGFLAFFGEGTPASRRTLWKLTRHDAPAFAAHHDEASIDRWTALTTDPLSRNLAARFMPEWSFLGGGADPGNGLRQEYAGAREVLATLATVDRPVRFTRELPRSGDDATPKAGLRLTVQAGHEPSEKWTLKVRAGGKELLSTLVDGNSTKGHWGTWEVDLSEFEGSGARVIVEQIAVDRPARGYWKRIDLVR